MIQRIQSLFLLLASAAFWLLFKLPFATASESVKPIFQDKVFNINDHSILLVLTILGGLITFINIFLYKNRGLQLRLNYVNIILSIFVAVVALWMVYSNGQSIAENVEIVDKFGLYLPLIALVLVILANVFISKDNKLVKSMDRLR